MSCKVKTRKSIYHAATKKVPKNQPVTLSPDHLNIRDSRVGWSYHKITFNSQKAKIWAKVKSFDQFHEN